MMGGGHISLKAFYCLLFTFLFNYSNSNAQIVGKGDPSPEGVKTEGISVSPAHFHMNQNPGETDVYEISVTNNTTTSQKFKVSLRDFNMNGKGKSNFLPPGEGKYSLSKWMNVSPSFFEVKAGEKKEVKLTVEVPNDTFGDFAAWNIIMLEQEEPRKTIEPPKQGDGTIALGVIPTFAFGVFAYQNPPNVSSNSVEVTNFYLDEQQDLKLIKIEAKNVGKGVAYCTAYVDLTNISTGTQKRLLVKKFTIVPELIRDFTFKLPDDLEEGEYVAVGVMDFEGSEEISVSKLKFVHK